MVDIQAQWNEFTQKLQLFFGFINEKLASFTTLSLGEQISFSAIGLGILLVLVSVILFIV